MVGRGHLGAAKVLGDLPNARIVGGDDYLRERSGLLAALDDMLDERLARDESQRFPGETGGSITGWDDAKHFHGLVLTTDGSARQAAIKMNVEWRPALVVPDFGWLFLN
jgi:hypothetical protein